MIWLVLLLLPAAWILCNEMYRFVHGRRLRWPYIWASQGALLFVRRFPEWEQR